MLVQSSEGVVPPADSYFWRYRMHSKIVLICGVAACLVGLPMMFAALNFNGVCVPRAEKLSDSSKIRIAVDQLLKVSVPADNVYAEENGRLVRLTAGQQPGRAYRNVNEFLAENPDCCIVEMTLPHLQHAPDMISRISGRFAGYVIIRYRERFGVDAPKKLAHVAISNCGKPWSGL